jgi:hypothetical protein
LRNFPPQIALSAELFTGADMLTNRERDIAEYRKQAELARELAEKALAQEVREGRLDVAREWDKLAEVAAKRTF